jgi:hypothetical protein
VSCDVGRYSGAAGAAVCVECDGGSVGCPKTASNNSGSDRVALIQFLEATGLSGWTGWDDYRNGSLPCSDSWFGITCSAGAVTYVSTDCIPCDSCR